MKPWKKLKGLLASLVEQESSPEEVALGVAVGIFIGFSPWYGIQIFIALACAYCIPRIHRVAVVAGAQINWVAPLYYYLEYRLGLVVLRRTGISLTIDTFRNLSVKKIMDHLDMDTVLGIFWPLFVGSLIIGAAGAVLAYFITRRIVERARARRIAV